MHRLDATREHAIGLFRIVVGFLFACHGVKTIFGVLGAHAAPVGAWPGWWAAVIQLAGGTLVALGLGTRAAALIGSGSMAFAYFTVHLAHGPLPIQNGGEPAALFCWALLVLVFTGPGRFALGRALAGRPAGTRTAPSAIGS
ncbi:DoxX family protein [Amycolatopsis sp. PS_44_ISF1]|uniref:DoxX family protein n=1 Tax=Amycolatopsis sp. PS_44_ISF1 TaxID=2974917 RepID=UPI0028DF1491|nr:DoxX family protein [Amycolatopsis sp. PS_44_ISF1]MDT8913381.1 DoxX family protein [Amycolatopsis sp. PS_44_ISF1]